MFAIMIRPLTGSAYTPPLLPAMVCVALMACSGTPTRGVAPAADGVAATAERLPAYVVKRGWHVDIGIALGDLKPPLLSAATELQGSRYLLFGFGDRGYVLHGGAGNALGALFGGAGLVLVTSLSQPQPEDVFGEDSVVRLALTPRQMGELQAFVWRTFALRNAAIIPVAPGSAAESAYSAYYESAHRYSGLYTCNTWAAEALKSAELPVSSSGVEFAWQLWEQVLRLERKGAETSSGERSGGSLAPDAATVSR